jgi:hypothetical protein
MSFDDDSITLPLADEEREETQKHMGRRAVEFGKTVAG